MNLTTYKAKKLAAKKGYDLLKRKADALKVLFSRYHHYLLLINELGSFP
jgi:vacuolar-type H+-ATPase subunit D/Vma8